MNPFDYPGLKELATHLAELLAMQHGEGWHTFSMNIKTDQDGKTVWVGDVSLVAADTKQTAVLSFWAGTTQQENQP